MSLEPSTLTLLVLVVMIALAFGATLGWLVFTLRAARLPAATRYADIEQRLAIAEEALDRKQEELRALDQKIADRDRLAAEAAALREQIEDLRAQLKALEPAREDIAATLKQAAAAAAQLATVEEELRQRQEELEALNRALDPDRIARLKDELATAQSELNRILAQLEPLRAERDTALRIIAEAAQQTARTEALRTQTERLEAERQQLESDLDRLREQLKDLDAVRQNLARLREACTEAEVALEAAREREARCAARVESLQAELEEISEVRDVVRDELKHFKQERDQLRREVQAAEHDLDRARLDLEAARDETDASRQARDALLAEARGLEERIRLLRDDLKDILAPLHAGGQAPGASAPLTDAQRKALLADLVARPACLATPEQLRGAPIEEPQALHQVRTHLQNAGLQFSNRVLKAFHTALKINDSAQITVLAGVSGTGKSLLPRRYAEAMGIHFLQVAVEPRWDSPQDLLGFYNYVEGKYRATELARLMASMDPWKSFGTEVPNYRDRLAMVLLDEMNLARVEYYFSEFLSRLEVRPPYAGGWPDRASCKDALIPVDIRGLENPPSLFPGQNILFVGTMNDDESTQSLSDKVLDRGNVMQFPAPTNFPPAGQALHQAGADALPFQSWRSWVRPPSALDDAPAAMVADVIRKLAAVMDAFGKPFGHRMNQSIRHYVANYPSETQTIDVKAALADQVEFRILPKLRGVEIGNHGQQFDELEQLIGETLGDTPLANRLKNLREDQEGRTGQFVWRGLARG